MDYFIVRSFLCGHFNLLGRCTNASEGGFHMEFKKISEMTSEELQKLPLVSVRVARIVLKDRKSNRVTSVRYEAQVQIHDLLTKRVNLKKSDYGLLPLASGKVSASEI